MQLFVDEVRRSDLPGRALLTDAHPDTWEAAMRLVAAGVDDGPVVIVIDEFPYLVRDDPALEATFQKLWDQVLSKKPVLLVLIGSDLAMMESLNDDDRAFHQRGTELVVPPLSPVEVAEITGAADAAAAFDAYLVTGGLSLVCEEWPAGMPMWEYLQGALHEQVQPPTSGPTTSSRPGPERSPTRHAGGRRRPRQATRAVTTLLRRLGDVP